MVNIPKAFFRKETVLYKNFSLGLMVNRAACAKPPYILAAHQRRLRPLSLTSFPFSPFFPARLCKVPIKNSAASAAPPSRHPQSAIPNPKIGIDSNPETDKWHRKTPAQRPGKSNSNSYNPSAEGLWPGHAGTELPYTRGGRPVSRRMGTVCFWNFLSFDRGFRFWFFLARNGALRKLIGFIPPPVSIDTVHSGSEEFHQSSFSLLWLYSTKIEFYFIRFSLNLCGC